MNANFSSLIMLAVMSAAAGLTGCTPAVDARHGRHHPTPANAQPTDAPTGAPGTAAEQEHRDMTERCRVYREMMDAATPQERGAMMDQRLSGMSREQMQRHMEMMRQKCQ